MKLNHVHKADKKICDFRADLCRTTKAKEICLLFSFCFYMYSLVKDDSFISHHTSLSIQFTPSKENWRLFIGPFQFYL
jgi:hypothetical protein